MTTEQEVTMRIFDISILRDGGTILFSIERNGELTRVALDTILHGEPRKLRINSSVPVPGAPAVKQLLADIDEWWNSIPSAVQTQTVAALSHKGAFYNPQPEMIEPIAFSRVLRVRDYALRYYAD
jgi:hypothetical protein